MRQIFHLIFSNDFLNIGFKFIFHFKNLLIIFEADFYSLVCDIIQVSVSSG